MLPIGAPAGSAAISTVSKTPTPPGTWLTTPAMVAAAKMARKVRKSGRSPGSST
ncbi:hypothetical protein Q5Y72_01435 [Paracoccus sp. 2205BS29-5]|uniref:Uncharacterized protein n=1 Tax=Paracoccus spongiarum TaxID=3064387 RepID=A0ABT9J9C2_9RHOB|nr:hypothetical protein [Paracoccus sp. 2205BS29-5]MDP5305762.1 hypothetical protein [Paracoccus sp. 2205BS29-5]